MVKISTVKFKRTHTKFVRTGSGRLKTTESTVRSRAKDTKDASQVLSSSVDQSRWEKLSSAEKQTKGGPVMVPVLSSTGRPLMPCHPARAKELIRKGRAKKRWFKGIFAIKLMRELGNTQQIAVGVDPGTKREAFTVKSKNHTYLNILSDSITWVSERLNNRREMRHERRRRKTPYKSSRSNRLINHKSYPTSIISRWRIKLNIIIFLKRLYPITDIIVEDVKAVTKGKKKWDEFFSPVEMGKNWFYDRCKELNNLVLMQGYETKENRDRLGLWKNRSKMAEDFWSHTVDSWVMANSLVGGHTNPDMIDLLRIAPIQLHRRQLHFLNPLSKGVRKPYGGTMSLGFKRGSVIKHKKHKLVYVGGASRGRISLHSISTGLRLTQNAKSSECEFLYHNSWKINWIRGN